MFLFKLKLVALGWHQVHSGLHSATNLMCDLGQVICLLWASVASSVKWGSWIRCVLPALKFKWPCLPCSRLWFLPSVLLCCLRGLFPYFHIIQMRLGVIFYYYSPVDKKLHNMFLRLKFNQRPSTTLGGCNKNLKKKLRGGENLHFIFPSSLLKVSQGFFFFFLSYGIPLFGWVCVWHHPFKCYVLVIFFFRLKWIENLL